MTTRGKTRGAAAIASAAASALALGAAPAMAADPAALDALLQRYVVDNPDGLARVRYGAWKASATDREALQAWIASAEATRVSTLPRPAQFAFWANLYNAVTLRVVLARYPVASIRDIKPTPISLGPWKRPEVTVEGKRLSLDDIEHGILRKQWREPRVHYAVNCASVGCPNLQRRAWRAETLERDLDAAARAYINSPRGVTIRADGALVPSSIYTWFRADFGGNEAGLRAHLARYASGPLKARLDAGARIAGHDYDWSLNDASR
jgi:hypothetical protein